MFSQEKKIAMSTGERRCCACVRDGTLRSVLPAEEPGFGTSPASVSPAAVAPARSQGLVLLSEGGLPWGWLGLQTPWSRHGGTWVSKSQQGFGRGARSGG